MRSHTVVPVWLPFRRGRSRAGSLLAGSTSLDYAKTKKDVLAIVNCFIESKGLIPPLTNG